MSQGEFLFRDSCGQKFTCTHHGHGNDCMAYIFNDLKEQELGGQV